MIELITSHNDLAELTERELKGRIEEVKNYFRNEVSDNISLDSNKGLAFSIFKVNFYDNAYVTVVADNSIKTHSYKTKGKKCEERVARVIERILYTGDSFEMPHFYFEKQGISPELKQ